MGVRWNTGVQAVRGVDLTLDPGEVVGVVGESGSGKTSLVMGLLGLVPLSEGEVYFHGQSIRDSGPELQRQFRSGVQPVFQIGRGALNPSRTVAQTLEEVLRFHATVPASAIPTEVEALMEQVRQISDAVEPHYTFLVVDAMTGQDAVTVAESFHQTLELDGVILTKLDGDARGGAALSVKEVVGRPIAFASTGEKIADFELFHPDRLAGRILGMGDMLTLIEKAEEAFEAEEAEDAARKLLEGQFTLDDFLDQMQQLKKMGPLQGILGMMPGVPKEVKDVEIDDREIGRIEAIIRSMTSAERADPDIIDPSRRERIAAGSGTKSSDVANLITQFREMRKVMKQFSGMGSKKRSKGRKNKKKGKGGGRTTPKGGPKAGKRGGGRVTPKGGAKDLVLPDFGQLADELGGPGGPPVR